MPKPALDDYVTDILVAISGQEENIQQAVLEVKRIKESDARIWVLGNGGSLATAQHFAQDLLKMRGVRAQCLNDPSVITAYTNDEGFENSFFLPLARLSDPYDLIFVFSCSGKSPNYSLIFGQITNRIIAVVGTDGGIMKDKADITIHIKSVDYRICEAAFGIVADLINIGLED